MDMSMCLLYVCHQRRTNRRQKRGDIRKNQSTGAFSIHDSSYQDICSRTKIKYLFEIKDQNNQIVIQLQDTYVNRCCSFVFYYHASQSQGV